MFAFNARKDSITDFADLCVSAKITPIPCVPSNNFITTGAPPTCSNTFSIFFGMDANAVFGIPSPAFANNCKLRSLSRERTSACDSTEEKTFICSNWRTTAAP